MKNDVRNKENNPTKKMIGSYLNDPFFVKKGEESKAFLDKVGFPDEIVKSRSTNFTKQ